MRVDGKALSLVIGGVEVRCDSTSVLLDNEQADADLVTFADVLNGDDVQWFISITGAADYGAATFWSLLWDTPAFDTVAYRLDPMGAGTTPTPSAPVFVGDATVDRKPPVGGDAGSVWMFDARLTCVGAPERLTA